MGLLSRAYRLVVGTPSVSTFTSDVFTNQQVVGIQDISVADDYRTETLNAVQITDAQIKAKVRSSSRAKAGGSDCVIEIYNLQASTREIVEKVNNYVIFEGGYASDPELKLLFAGQVVTFETRRSGHDLITTLRCKDGYIANAGVRVAKAYPKGKTFGYVINDLAKTFAKAGIPTGNMELEVPLSGRQNYVQLRSPTETKIPEGYSVFGFLADVLDNVCKQIGYVNYITNGRLFVHPKGYTKTIEQFEYSNDALYSVKKTGSASNTSTGLADIGVKLSVHLDGRLDVDKQIKILDGDYEGTYKILDKVHNMDYEMGKWVTEIDAKAVVL